MLFKAEQRRVLLPAFWLIADVMLFARIVNLNARNEISAGQVQWQRRTLIWFLRWSFRWNVRSHTEQLNGFRSECIRACRTSLNFELNGFLHWSHLYGELPLWLSWCLASLLPFWNDFWHTFQPKSVGHKLIAHRLVVLPGRCAPFWAADAMEPQVVYTVSASRSAALTDQVGRWQAQSTGRPSSSDWSSLRWEPAPVLAAPPAWLFQIISYLLITPHLTNL